MGFFDDLPVPELPKWTQQRSRPRIWQDPGRNVVPTTLVVDGLLVRRPEFAVFASGFRVYPSGFEFMVTVLREPLPPGAPRGRRTETPFFSYPKPDGTAPEPARQLKFGVRFADGRSAVTEPRIVGLHKRASHPEPPVISLRGGTGGNGRWQQTLWAWGLPDEGDVSLVYSWADQDIPESRLELDGDALREAAGRATVLWEEPEEPKPSEARPEVKDEEDGDVTG